MIEVSNLTKRYGKKAAVDNISFSVEKGEILGFLGPNGAGKTTTMNILTGYIAATTGQCKIAGFDILEEPLEAKRHIGYLPEQPPVYGDMTVEEFLKFVFELKKAKGDFGNQILEIMDKTKVLDVRHRLIRNLSKGYKQRVGIAQAMIGNPEVLILDEPTVGLDPNQIIETRALIKELGKEHTIILSTHILSEVSAVCDRIIIINNGKIVAIDTPEHLASRVQNTQKLMVRVNGDVDQVTEVLQSIEDVLSVEVSEQKEPNVFDYLVSIEAGKDIKQALFYALAEKQLPILQLQNVEMSLEEAFVEITSKDMVLDGQDEEEADAEEEFDEIAEEDLNIDDARSLEPSDDEDDIDYDSDTQEDKKSDTKGEDDQ